MITIAQVAEESHGLEESMSVRQCIYSTQCTDYNTPVNEIDLANGPVKGKRSTQVQGQGFSTPVVSLPPREKEGKHRRACDEGGGGVG